MKTDNLKKMKKGWFIGDFNPSLYRTDNFEVGIKRYKKGDKEEAHFHKVATEYTVVVDGTVRMFDIEFSGGDIIIAEPGDVTDFISLTDSVTAVVKIPCVKDDKYIVGDERV